MIEIDALTGLPVIPNGYFWRVRPYYYQDMRLRVGLRRKLLWFSYEKDFEFAHDYKGSIIAAAERAVRTNFPELGREDFAYGAEFHGDYPPKTLKKEEK